LKLEPLKKAVGGGTTGGRSGISMLNCWGKDGNPMFYCPLLQKGFLAAV